MKKFGNLFSNSMLNTFERMSKPLKSSAKKKPTAPKAKGKVKAC